MSFLNNSTTERHSVCRQLGQKKAALTALTGPDLRRKAHGAER